MIRINKSQLFLICKILLFYCRLLIFTTTQSVIMFTLPQIQSAHSRVKSGADFPAYIKDIKALGVISYETYVTDGHTDYYGADNYKISSPAKYNALIIAVDCNAAQFKTDLQAHQQGKTNYPTFCADCAAAGINKWAVAIHEMTCTYYDIAGNEVLTEQIPQ
jgi:uncharacterized protein YbcV (DUF1398 family)